MKRLFYILLFAFSFLFYWNTGRTIENRTEAEDVFEYALMVEEGGTHDWFYHRHHLLYGPTMKLTYGIARTVGYSGRAIGIMRVVSALSASGTLFFFFLFCYRRYSLRPVSSLLASAFFGLTYGFWRYSAESEIPLLASLIMVAALYFSTDTEERHRSFGLAVLFSVLSVLVHVMNAVAVFVAIPCFYLMRKRWKATIFHVVLTGGLVMGTYGFIARMGTIYGGSGTQLSMIGFGSFIKAIVAFLQCVVSCDFMLGFASVRAFLGELFAGRMLLEEFYLGVRLPRYHVLFSTATFLAFFVMSIACVLRAGWVWKNIVADRNRLHLPDGLQSLVAAGIFFFGYGGLLLFIEPGNPELWVMGLMPFTLLLCGLILLPLTYDNRLWLPFLMVLILFVHNAGAIRMLHDPDKDYQHQKSRVVLENTERGDIVITAGNPVFERYLRYHFKGEVSYLYNYSPEQLASVEVPNAIGDIYVMGDVFSQARALTVRFPEKTSQIKVFACGIRQDAELVEDNEFGGLYKLNR